MKHTLLIVDDHVLVRQTWSFILNTNPAFTVIGECGSGEEAIEKAMLLKPDIILMDINLPGINGIEATEIICQQMPGCKVLAISLHTQPTYARRMMQKGAMGYVTKNSSREEMFEALAAIAAGKKFICNEIKEILSEQMLNNRPLEEGIHSLSPREIEIIGYIKKGASSKDIADKLLISVKTVEVHRHHILKKLNLKNTAALVNYINTVQPHMAE